MSCYRTLLCLLTGAVLLQCSRGVAETWREVKSPHFTVVTDGSDKDGRDVAKEFEQMRSVFVVRMKNPVLETAAPLLIVATREPGLHELAHYFWQERDQVAGQFFRGWERQYALVRLDSFGDLNQAVVFHEYTHSVFHANLHWMPEWLDEGLAEFYGYTEFRGDHIYVGAPSLRMAHLKSETLTPVAEMLTLSTGKFMKDPRRVDLFYGEAWAMVHYMTFGKDMQGGARMNEFIGLLEAGTPQLEAFEKVFGDPKAFDDKLSQYVNGLTISAALLPPGEKIDEKTFPTRVLSPAEADYAIGSFDEGPHAFAEAKVRLQAAEVADPSLAGPHEELGYLAWMDGDDDKARAEWQKAVAADGGRYRSEFALLMSKTSLKDESAQQLMETERELEAIHAKEPRYAPALVEIAMIQWRLGQINLAYHSAMAAEKLEPWRAEYHLLTARILLQGKQAKLAATYARQVANRWPGSDHDEAVDVWDRVPVADRGDGPPLTVSVPADATVVRGTIVSTACGKPGLTVVVQPDDAKAATVTAVATGGFESGFADTLWVGEDHYTPCHHLEGLPTLVAYKNAGDGKRLEIFEVRDNLPDEMKAVSATVATTASAAKP